MNESLNVAIDKLRQGDQQGFRIVYDETHNYVYTRARMLLNNEADANDLVQEVYINAYRYIGSLQENQKIYAWLGGIAFNQATKILRKNKDVLIKEEDEIFDTIVDLDPDKQPENAIEKDASAKLLLELIEQLPEVQKSILMAYYYDEMSVKEIAEAFECSEGTIKSRLNYARKGLKTSIRDMEKRDGIKLYSCSLPLLLLAFHYLTDEYHMEPTAANAVYQNCVSSINSVVLNMAQSSVSVKTAEKVAKGTTKVISKKVVTWITVATLGLGATGGITVSYIVNNHTEQAAVAPTKSSKQSIVPEKDKKISNAMKEPNKATELPIWSITAKPTHSVLPDSTQSPTPEPIPSPTPEPTQKPTQKPTPEPTPEPTQKATQSISPIPTQKVTPKPIRTNTPKPIETPNEEDDFSLDSPEISIESTE